MALDPEAREKLRRVIQKHRAEKQEYIDALQEAVDENDDLQKKVKDAETLRAEHDKLKGEVKGQSFRKAFEKAAAKAGVKPEHMDDAYELAKLKTDGDPDEKAIGESVKGLVKSRKWLTEGDDDDDQAEGQQDGQGDGEGQDQGQGQGQGQGERLPKGEGLARGSASKGPAGKYVVNRASLNDFDWMAKNGAAFNEAAAKGTLHLIGNP